MPRGCRPWPRSRCARRPWGAGAVRFVAVAAPARDGLARLFEQVARDGGKDAAGIALEAERARAHQ